MNRSRLLPAVFALLMSGAEAKAASGEPTAKADHSSRRQPAQQHELEPGKECLNPEHGGSTRREAARPSMLQAWRDYAGEQNKQFARDIAYCSINTEPGLPAYGPCPGWIPPPRLQARLDYAAPYCHYDSEQGRPTYGASRGRSPAAPPAP